MKKVTIALVIVCIAFSMAVVGCGPKKAETPKEAIETSKTMDATKARENYLVAQAKAFYNAKDYKGAVELSKYVINFVDKNSVAAQDILQKAQEDLRAQMQQAANELKQKFSAGK